MKFTDRLTTLETRTPRRSHDAIVRDRVEAERKRQIAAGKVEQERQEALTEADRQLAYVTRLPRDYETRHALAVSLRESNGRCRSTREIAAIMGVNQTSAARYLRFTTAAESREWDEHGDKPKRAKRVKATPASDIVKWRQKTTKVEIGGWIKRRRRAIKMSGVAVASALGVDKQLVRDWESGVRKPSLEQVEALFALLT